MQCESNAIQQQEAEKIESNYLSALQKVLHVRVADVGVARVDQVVQLL
jgi:hypothetical protein